MYIIRYKYRTVADQSRPSHAFACAMFSFVDGAICFSVFRWMWETENLLCHFYILFAAVSCNLIIGRILFFRSFVPTSSKYFSFGKLPNELLKPIVAMSFFSSVFDAIKLIFHFHAMEISHFSVQTFNWKIDELGKKLTIFSVWTFWFSFYSISFQGKNGFTRW